MFQTRSIQILTLTGLFILAASIVNAATLKIANYYAVDHPVNIALKTTFKPMVEEKTAKKLNVQIYPNNQLGAEQEFIEGVQLGTIEMAMTGNMWENTVPQFRIMQLPYMFVSFEHADTVLNGAVGESIYAYLEPLNVKVLASFPNGFRCVSNNKRPVRSLEDTKGIKLRVFQGATIIKEMKALGFSTVVLPFSEIFPALQQGVVDGQDNPLATAYYAGWYEVQKHVAITNHMYSPGYITINKSVYDKLTDAQKQVVKEAARMTARAILESIKGQTDQIIKEISAKNVTVTRPDLKPFMEKVSPIVDEYTREYPEVKNLVEQIQSLSKDFL